MGSSHYWVVALRAYQLVADVYASVGSLADARTRHSLQLIVVERLNASKSQSNELVCGSSNNRRDN